MTTKRQVVADEQLGQLSRKTRELQERIEKGILPFDRAMEGIQLVIEGKLPIPTVHVTSGSSLSRAYRKMKGLFVVGPSEYDKLFRTRENPLNLKKGWVPDIEIAPRDDAWIRSGIWRDDEEWKTRAALVLTPHRVGVISTNLMGQNKLFGVGHDGVNPGIIRRDVFWNNYFVGKEDDAKPDCLWAIEAAVSDWRWILTYEHVLFTVGKNWGNQQLIAKEKGMSISTVSQDAWALNVVRAAYGESLRLSTWSRTSTIVDGCSLVVSSHAVGIDVSRRWSPEHADSDIAASAQGVPGNFDP